MNTEWVQGAVIGSHIGLTTARDASDDWHGFALLLHFDRCPSSGRHRPITKNEMHFRRVLSVPEVLVRRMCFIEWSLSGVSGSNEAGFGTSGFLSVRPTGSMQRG